MVALILLRPDGSEVGRLIEPKKLAQIDQWLVKIGPRIAKKSERDRSLEALLATAEVWEAGKQRRITPAASARWVEAIATAWGVSVVTPRKPGAQVRKISPEEKFSPDPDSPAIRLVVPAGLSLASRLGATTALEVWVMQVSSESDGRPEGGARSAESASFEAIIRTENGSLRTLVPLDGARSKTLKSALEEVLVATTVDL